MLTDSGSTPPGLPALALLPGPGLPFGRHGAPFQGFPQARRSRLLAHGLPLPARGHQAPRLSAWPCSPRPHAAQMERTSLTTRWGVGNKQQRPHPRNSKSIRKCAEVGGGGQLGDVVGEEGFASWSLLWKRPQTAGVQETGGSSTHALCPAESSPPKASIPEDARGAGKGPGSQSSPVFWLG